MATRNTKCHTLTYFNTTHFSVGWIYHEQKQILKKKPDTRTDVKIRHTVCQIGPECDKYGIRIWSEKNPRIFPILGQSAPHRADMWSACIQTFSYPSFKTSFIQLISTYVNIMCLWVCVCVCSRFSRTFGILLGYPLAQMCFLTSKRF